MRFWNEKARVDELPRFLQEHVEEQSSTKRKNSENISAYSGPFRSLIPVFPESVIEIQNDRSLDSKNQSNALI